MEFIGRNSIINLKEIVKGRVLMFTQSGIYNIFADIINNELQAVDVTFFNQITENPKREEIKAAQDSLKNQDFDCIIAFSGGSVIDFAKAFRFYDKRKVHLIAIPTTAGTGSQATQFAVVYIEGVKTSLDNPEILPDFVIADSQFVENAPRYLKACSSIDAYCQAIESFWAVKSTDESKKYALEAIEICRDYIIDAVNTSDKKANEQMVKAAHLAGKAINISRTTAAHALSYKITSEYGIPHGHAVALSISGLFKLNIEYIHDANILLEAIGITKNDIISYFHNLMSNINLEHNLVKLSINNLNEIVDGVNFDRLSNNPIKLTKDNLFELFTVGA